MASLESPMSQTRNIPWIKGCKLEAVAR